MASINTNFSANSMQELAAIIAKHLHHNDIKVVLVGGLAVGIYTENRYLTKDIDMVDLSYQKPCRLQAAMAELDFHKQGRYFHNSSTVVLIEFPSAPLAVGDELITELTTASGSFGEIPIIFAIDLVKDRLAAYFHWQDQQSLVQALCIMLCHNITPKQLESFCIREGGSEEYERIAKLQQSLKQSNTLEMIAIEEHIVAEHLKEL